MKQFIGTSQRGDLQEALLGLNAPAAILLMTNADQFAAHVEQLEAAFPGVPSIGCIGMSYDTRVVEKGVSVIAFTDGAGAAANVIENASSMPVKHIERLQKDLDRIGASSQNTVCIDFCTGNDACVLTTMYSVLGPRKISLMGGTGDAGKVSVNGKIYEDADAYLLVKNNGGKVKVYKENIYEPRDDYRLIAFRTDRATYMIGELNGRPAKQVYQEILQIGDKEMETQTFQNPLGKVSGQDMCIIALKEIMGNAFSCYRPVNDSDVLTILELKDHQKVINETVSRIKADFHRISGVFSVNCLFRYLLFSQNNEVQKYLDTMGTLGCHGGLIGYGEHFNDQFINQSMTCVVFE